MVGAAPKAAARRAGRDEQEQGMQLTSGTAAHRPFCPARLAVQAGAGRQDDDDAAPTRRHDHQSRVLYVAFNKAISWKPPSGCRRTSAPAPRVRWRGARLANSSVTAPASGRQHHPSTVSRAFGCTPLAATAACRRSRSGAVRWRRNSRSEHLPVDVASRLPDPAGLVALAGRLEADGRTDRHEIRSDYDGYLKLYQMDRPVLRAVST